MKSKDQGICRYDALLMFFLIHLYLFTFRICLHVFEKSRLALFSTKMKPSEDKTIQGCLTEILPSISVSRIYKEVDNLSDNYYCR